MRDVRVLQRPINIAHECARDLFAIEQRAHHAFLDVVLPPPIDVVCEQRTILALHPLDILRRDAAARGNLAQAMPSRSDLVLLAICFECEPAEVVIVQVSQFRCRRDEVMLRIALMFNLRGQLGQCFALFQCAVSFLLFGFDLR
jgi:hypothetical protein